jgi:hypothetical protein
MSHQISHLDPPILEALNSTDPPDATRLKQAGITGLDIRRACRLLEEHMSERLGGVLSIDEYNERATRWHRNRDYLCEQLERQCTALLRDGTGCCGRIRAILAGIWGSLTNRKGRYCDET